MFTEHIRRLDRKSQGGFSHLKTGLEKGKVEAYFHSGGICNALGSAVDASSD
jgi:hypothetical protein